VNEIARGPNRRILDPGIPCLKEFFFNLGEVVQGNNRSARPTSG